MRIALIYLGRRGAGGIISFELARQLREKRQVTAYLSLNAENANRWVDAGIDFIRVDTFNNALSALWSLVFPAQIHRIARQILLNKPDILVFPMFHPWNSLIQKELKSIPSVVFVHDPHPHPDLPGKFYEIMENASIRRAARCVVLSEGLKPFLVDRGCDQDCIDVVPLGPFVYTPSIQPVPHKNRTPTLLFFGRILPYKGLKTLLYSYIEVRKNFPCQLVIAGDGDISSYLDKLEHLQDVTLVNRWIGENEIGEFFTRSDLVVLPYSSASQSGVIPIAAAYGLPVIATRVGGLSEQIEDGVSGWLIPPDDVQALTSTIREVLSNLHQARQRGEALKDRYEKQFGWGQAAKKLMGSLDIAVRDQGLE